MNEPVIQANTSLVLNGDFAEGLTGWTRGSSGDLVAVIAEFYEGEQIRILSMQDGASVSQWMGLDVDSRANARYVLSFLCETRHVEPGRLVVSVEGSAEQLEIELPPGAARDSVEDQVRLDAGLPLELIPRSYEAELSLPLEKGGRVRVNIFSPVNRPNDIVSMLCITRIRILLYIEPLVLQQVRLDDQVLPPDRPLYLCVGATASNENNEHRFSCEPVPGNPWLYTEAALVSDDNPQGAIIATPVWGKDQPLDEDWQLEGPLMVIQEPIAFSISLLNRYTAEAYLMAASFGDHRLQFLQVQEAAYYPVFEYGQGVRLGVLVASHYTKQILGGRTVTWTLDGQRIQSSVSTDDSGWAYFDYEPTAAGDFELVASVESLYYATGVVTRGMNVRVLATDPWKDLKVNVEGHEVPWDDATGYPNRGSAYPLKLKFPADSPLWETALSLQWEGESSPERLGVTVNPPLDRQVPVTDEEPEWTLTCEDRLDGRFYLSLGCSKLLLPSSRRPMSLARNLVRIGEVREANKSPVVDELESVLLRLQVLHVIASGSGDPVVNALVEWDGPNGAVATITGAGGWASVLDVPRQAGNYTITAKVRAHEQMQPVERPFAVTALATSPWKGQATFYLDDVPVDLAKVGMVCRRGGTHTFRVAPTPGSPAQGKPMSLRISVQEPGLGLTIGTPTATADGGWQWPLTSVAGTRHSGLFECLLHSDAWTQDRTLSGRLLSQNLADEVSVALDQVQATVGTQTLYPCLGALHRFIVLPHALSPLVGLDANLQWSGTSAEQLGATVEPALSETQAISDGGALWLLGFTASQQRGHFSLALQLPQLNQVSAANGMTLGHNNVSIALAHEPAVDPIVGQDRAWMWAQVISAYTGQPVAQVPVTWSREQDSQTLDTDAHGWSGFGLMPAVVQTQAVEVSVLSLYDGFEDTRSLTFNVLTDDPWKDLCVSFDGSPEQRWGAMTCFPRRKEVHSIRVRAPADSPLLEHDLTLGMTGTGPAALGLNFLLTPLGAPRDFSSGELLYELQCDDLRDGSFALRLAATRLAKLSPANAMSLGVGSRVLKIVLGSRAQQTLDWGQELYEQVTVVSSISGKPLAGITVTWQSPDLGVVTRLTDFYGVARVHFKPITAGAQILTATVGDQAYSESVTLAFAVNEPRRIESLTSASASGYPGDEVEAQAFVVSALTGLPLSGVEVMWEYASVSLAPTTTDAQGKATVRFTLGMPGATVLSATVRGGEAGWEVQSLLFTVQQDALKITELLSEDTTIYLGEEADARACVVYQRHGVPAQNVEVTWTYPQLQLAPSLTDSTGFAGVSFTPNQLGDFDLVAQVGGTSPDVKFLRLQIERVPERALITNISAERNPINRNETGRVTVTVNSSWDQRPMQGIRVYWTVNGSGYESVTNAQGMVTFEDRYSFPGVVEVNAQVRNSYGGHSSAGLGLMVE